MKWTPKDVIALVVIIGGIYLLAAGINGRVGIAHICVIAGYYGIDLTPWIKIGRIQKPKNGGG